MEKKSSAAKKRERDWMPYGGSSEDEFVRPASFSDLPDDPKFIERQQKGGIKYRQIKDNIFANEGLFIGIGYWNIGVQENWGPKKERRPEFRGKSGATFGGIWETLKEVGRI